jgi:tRNA modification GTPase
MTVRMALLTAPGAGAIATIALRGPTAYSLVRDLALPPLPAEPQGGRVWLRRLQNAATDLSDEVVIAILGAGDEQSVELHCHGGRQATQWLVNLLAQRGAEECNWQELETSTAPKQATAALDVLTNALTARTASIALDQYRGAWARAIDDIAAALAAKRFNDAAEMSAALERRADIGRHLATPWRVTVAGAVNVGKSSLVNAIAGYKRSVVSPTPGTTRDVVTVAIALAGWPVEVADTAGWRDSTDAVESEGIARAQSTAAESDLILWVLDQSAIPQWPPANLGRSIVVINKTDLPAAWEAGPLSASHVSAETSAGIGDLCDRIAEALVPSPPPPGAAVPFTPELASGIASVGESIRNKAIEAAQEKLANLRVECN